MRSRSSCAHIRKSGRGRTRRSRARTARTSSAARRDARSSSIPRGRCGARATTRTSRRRTTSRWRRARSRRSSRGTSRCSGIRSTERYGFAARRRAAGATSITALLTVPQAEETRTQNCVGAVIGAVMSVGELRPTGLVKSSSGPWYHWYDSDAPVAAMVRRALVPAAALTADGCETIAGGVHELTTVIVTALLSIEPQSFVIRSQYDVVPLSSVGVVIEARLAFGTGREVSLRAPSYHW